MTVLSLALVAIAGVACLAVLVLRLLRRRSDAAEDEREQRVWVTMQIPPEQPGGQPEVIRYLLSAEAARRVLAKQNDARRDGSAQP